MKCSIRGCKNKRNARGMCKSHYDAWIRTGNANSYRGDRSNMTLWDKILEIGWTTNQKTKCKEWNGYRNEFGYGLYRNGSGPLVRVHRLAFERKLGRKLLRSEYILHKCDNPSCSNVSHLKIGNQKENMKDMWSRGRGFSSGWKHCPNGHKYPKDRPVGVQKNRCKECTKERNKRYYAKKKLSPL